MIKDIKIWRLSDYTLCELILSIGKTWLFPGKDNEKSISKRSAQMAYNIAKQRAGIERGQGIYIIKIIWSLPTNLLKYL